MRHDLKNNARKPAPPREPQMELQLFAPTIPVPFTIVEATAASPSSTAPRDRVHLPRDVRPSWPVVISYGMGVDSTAMLILLRNSGIVPSLLLFADTGGERPETYAYKAVINDWLARHGFPTLTVVQYTPVTAEYNTLYDNCKSKGMLVSMAYSMGMHGCSLKFKVGVLDQYVGHWAPAVETWKRGGRVVRVIGYDDSGADNKRRIRFEGKGGGNLSENGKYQYWYPLQDAHWDRAECIRRIEEEGLPVPPKSACYFCLAGETEVVTREGVRPIRELAGSSHRLLVPQMGTKGGLGHRGSFQHAEVQSFGVQPLWAVTLRRPSQVRTLRATAEHRWFLAAPTGAQWLPASTYERTTQTLKQGDVLRTLRATAPAREPLMPVAVAQGFVFGDGTRQMDREGPASVTIYNPAKDSVILPYFGAHTTRPFPHKGREALLVYGLPRFWKERPPLHESRSFLLSWLAGYFAADGSVSKSGLPVLESAVRENLEFVRDVAAVCGVGYADIRQRMREGFPGREPSALYRLTLRAADLPEWFFIIENHRKNAAAPKRRLERPWVVESVKPLEIVEEVFCAVVPNVGAFGLAGDLMTGNCPSSRPYEVIELVLTHPDLALKVVELEMAAGPNLEMIDGLWGTGSKGSRGGIAKPGSWTEFMLEWMIDGRAYQRMPQVGDPGVVAAEMQRHPHVSKVYRSLPMLDPDAAKVAALAAEGTQAALALRAEIERRYGAGSVDAMIEAGRLRTLRRLRLLRGRTLAKWVADHAAELAQGAPEVPHEGDEKAGRKGDLDARARLNAWRAYTRLWERAVEVRVEIAPLLDEFGADRLNRVEESAPVD